MTFAKSRFAPFFPFPRQFAEASRFAEPRLRSLVAARSCTRSIIASTGRIIELRSGSPKPRAQPRSPAVHVLGAARYRNDPPANAQVRNQPTSHTHTHSNTRMYSGLWRFSSQGQVVRARSSLYSKSPEAALAPAQLLFAESTSELAQLQLCQLLSEVIAVKISLGASVTTFSTGPQWDFTVTFLLKYIYLPCS